MDQDDSMISTPSSHEDVDESLITNPNHDDEEELYPDAMNPQIARPQTPLNDHLNAAAPGELSPPRSQTVTRANTGAFKDSSVPDEDLDLSPTNPNTASGAAQQSTEWKAGYGWKNKKSQMEMQKAWENMVDRDFSLKQYGDPLAHRIGVQGAQGVQQK